MMRDQKLWTWHLIAGLLVFILLGLHMGIMHLDASLGIFNPADGHPIDWANVVARARAVGFTVTYVLLLGAALFHGLYGFRNILFELGLGSGPRSLTSRGLLVLGVALFILGTWAAWASYQLANAV